MPVMSVFSLMEICRVLLPIIGPKSLNTTSPVEVSVQDVQLHTQYLAPLLVET